MRPLSAKWAAAGLLALLLAPDCPAQRGGRGGAAMMQVPARLLLQTDVQDELKLSTAQKDKLQNVVAKRNEKMKQSLGAAPPLRQAVMQAAMQEALVVASQVERQLKPDQTKRLRQLHLQSQGVQAFLQPAVHQRLKLTAKQSAAIREAGQKLQQQTQETFQGLAPGQPGKRAEAMKKLAGLRQEAADKAVATLTEKQKKTWEQMTGPKFEFKETFPGFGRGRQ
jgi:hypothetical protein